MKNIKEVNHNLDKKTKEDEIMSKRMVINGKFYKLVEDSEFAPAFNVGDTVYAPFVVSAFKYVNDRFIYYLSLNHKGERPFLVADADDLKTGADFKE